MYTEKELLHLAGKLAMACHQVLISNVYTITENIKNMEIALKEYDNAIVQNVNEK